MRTFKSLVISKSFADLVYEEYVQNTTKRKNDGVPVLVPVEQSLETGSQVETGAKKTTQSSHRPCDINSVSTVEGKPGDSVSHSQLIDGKSYCKMIGEGERDQECQTPFVLNTEKLSTKSIAGQDLSSTTRLTPSLRFSDLNLSSDESNNYNNVQLDSLKSDDLRHPVAIINHLRDLQTFIRRRLEANS